MCHAWGKIRGGKSSGVKELDTGRDPFKLLAPSDPQLAVSKLIILITITINKIVDDYDITLFKSSLNQKHYLNDLYPAKQCNTYCMIVRPRGHNFAFSKLKNLVAKNSFINWSSHEYVGPILIVCYFIVNRIDCLWKINELLVKQHWKNANSLRGPQTRKPGAATTSHSCECVWIKIL